MADSKIEPLITMDTPEEDSNIEEYVQKITIPSDLTTKTFGDFIKKVLFEAEMVNINLDWRDALPHPNECVKFEFWTNSNDQCGAKCGFQLEFVNSYKGVAHLSRRAIANILPTTSLCIVPFLLSKQCKSQYINHGATSVRPMVEEM